LAAAALFLLSTTAPGQSWPPGFAAPTPFVCNDPSAAPFVRATWSGTDKIHLVAVRDRLFAAQTDLAHAGPPRLVLGNEDIAYVTADATRVWVGGLRTGRVRQLDRGTLQLQAVFAGPANAFDAVALPSGDLLLSANPNWPQAGANSGLWLAGPGRQPRELLPLQGPSGPLALAANGDLVLGELGPIVPPPPGAARLLRIAAARVQAAVAGATLGANDIAASGAGYTGIYDLALDDRDRCLVSDPASGVVQHTAPGGLVPVGALLDLGPGRFVTRLQFLPGALTPFRGYGPSHGSASLMVGSSDYTSRFELHRVQPQRPRCTISPGLTLTPGTAQLQVHDGPPNGLCLWLASTVLGQGEHIALWLGGAPLWLGLPTTSAVALGAHTLDAQGGGSWSLLHPGGLSGRLDLQAVVLAPAASELGSAPLLPLLLLP
jgi:hypothetical protein